MQNLFKKIDDGVKAVFESESYKDCLGYMSKFTNYSAGNCILIMLQKPDASLVAAFGKWKELGRTINKGEKGIAILAPMSFKTKELKEQPVKDSSGNQVYNADGSEKKEKVEVEQTSIGFKKVYVFDVSQTSGEPMPDVQGVGVSNDDDFGVYVGGGQIVFSSAIGGCVQQEALEYGNWTSWCTFDAVSYPQEVWDRVNEHNSEEENEGE